MVPELVAPPGVERRRHPRREVDLPVALRPVGGDAEIRCWAVDLSVGGARLTAAEVVPPGRCDLVVLADDVAVSLTAEVLEVVVDADTGSVTARLRFLDPPPTAQRSLARLTAHEGAAPDTGRRRRTRLLAALGVGAVAVIGLAVSAGLGDDEGERVSAGGPTADAPPAAVTRVESADNAVRVVLTADSADVTAVSAAGESEAGDDVQVRIDVEPARVPGGVAIVVSLANQGREALTFAGDGLRATVRARRGAEVVAQVVLTAGAAELGPGGRTSLRGVLALSDPGAYDLEVSVPVSG